MRKLPKYLAAAAISMAATAALPQSQLWAQDRESRPKEQLIQADDLPDEVRRTIEREAIGTNHFIDRRGSGDSAEYIVHYTAPDGQRMRLETDDRGRVVKEPAEARVQPEKGLEEEHNRDEADRSVRYSTVTEDEVPDRVLKTMDRYRKGSHDPFFRRQIRDGKTFYSVHYTTPESERMWVRVAENGEVAEGPHINIGRDIGLQLARADDRDRGRGRGQDRDRARGQDRADERRADRGRDRDRDRDRGERPAESRRNEQMRVEELTAGELPEDVRRSIEQETAGGTEHRFVRESRGGEVTYFVEYTKDGKRGNLRVDDRGKVLGETEVAGAPREAQMERQELTASELPEDVRRSIEKETAGGSEHLFVRESRNGEVSYFVEYTKDGQRGNLRVDERGRVLGETEVAGARRDAEMQRQELTAAELPAEVRRTVEQETAGGSEHLFVRESRNGEVSYFVEYTKDGQRGNLRLDERGKVLGETEVAGTPQPRPDTPSRPVPASDDDAELAAGGAASSHLVVPAGELPAEVRQALEQQTQGGSEHIFQRHTQEGRVVYTAHYRTADDDHNIVVVDEKGQVLVEPRKSRWLEAAKGVRFEQLGADQLPAEVREVVEKQTAGGSEHLFLRRVRTEAEPTYLVQFTNAKGRRMQMEVNANGKLREEPSAAQEQPFRMLGRQQDREDRRSDRR